MIQPLKYFPILLIVLFTLSCDNQNVQSVNSKDREQVVIKDKTAIKYGAGDVVTKGYLDRSGNMWFTTTEEGVFKFDGSAFVNYTLEDGLCGNDVWSIFEDKDGNMWFGTTKGLCKFDGTTFENITLPREEITSDWMKSVYPMVNPNGVSSVIQDKNGVFWIGSNGAGAYRYDGSEFTSYLKKRGNLMPDSLHHNVIISILEDQKGHIWFSSFSHGGVSEYDGHSFTHHALKDGYGDGMIASGYIDPKGNLWFGTRNGGIYRYDGKAFENIADSESGEQIAMATIFVDSRETIWVASYARSGVFIYDGNTFLQFEVENSNKLVDIKCISEDKEGNIWFGGRYGILWRYDGEELKDFTFEKRIKN